MKDNTIEWHEFPKTLPPTWSDVLLKIQIDSNVMIVFDVFLDCYFGFERIGRNIENVTHWTEYKAKEHGPVCNYPIKCNS